MKAKHTHKEFYEGVRRYKSASVMRKENPSLYWYGDREGLLKNTIWPNPKYNLHSTEDFYNGVQVYRNPHTMRKENPRLWYYGVYHGLHKNVDWPDGKRRVGVSEELLMKEVFDTSRKCHSRGEFAKKYPKDYKIAYRRGWLDKMHWLKPMENPIKDRNNYVYAYVFERKKTVYIGLTYHGSERHIQHKHGGPVFNFAKENNIDVPEPIILEDNLNRLNEVRKQEHYWKLHYISLGYNTLNRGKTGEFSGSIGALVRIWTRKKCREVALLCSHSTEMAKRFPSAYNAARKNGWLKDYTWFVVISRTPRPVLQYTNSGVCIGRYDSIAAAAKAVKISESCIRNCCTGKTKFSSGCVWKFANESTIRAKK